MDKNVETVITTSNAERQSPLLIPPSLGFTSKNMAAVETRRVTSQHGSVGKTDDITKDNAQVFSHQDQPYTLNQYPVSTIDTSWHYSGLRIRNSAAVPASETLELGCSFGDNGLCHGRSNLTWCSRLNGRKPTSSSVDLWRLQAGWQNRSCQWTDRVVCRPYWNPQHDRIVFLFTLNIKIKIDRKQTNWPEDTEKQTRPSEKWFQCKI